ncbi:MAG TPA: formylglycine-generating enzyme family protein [Planctomycetaceae bacterium]|nr:formylglycine-generating enzyme family protein [Planctomycetaceae bacterium]
MLRSHLTYVFSLLLVASFTQASDLPGLVKEKPAEGLAVKTDQGWMVPYDTTIPGTDVVFRMLPVPGGEYEMGSDEAEPGHKADEAPIRKVVVEPFWMAECEVKWEEYKLFMQLYRSLKEFEERRIRTVTETNKIDAVTAPTPLYEPDFTFEYGEDPKQPAVSMTQYAAKQYTKWLTGITGQQFRLPTEAEWEYACRAGSTTAFSFGDDEALLDEYGWFSENTDAEGTKNVRQKKPNPWGFYDMHGNAAEWVIDGYAPYAATDKPINAAADWVRTDQPDPRVVRGGSWEFPAADSRSSARLGSNDIEWKAYDPNRPRSPWWFTTDPARGVGFRLFRALKPLPREEIEEFWKIDSEDIEFDVEDRVRGGRGVLGLVDKDLPQAILDLQK